jgi:hypothetical protein
VWAPPQHIASRPDSHLTLTFRALDNCRAEFAAEGLRVGARAESASQTTVVRESESHRASSTSPRLAAKALSRAMPRDRASDTPSDWRTSPPQEGEAGLAWDPTFTQPDASSSQQSASALGWAASLRHAKDTQGVRVV